MSGIYIHIPFCKQACHYCDFHFSTSLKMKSDMLSALSKELVMRKEEQGAGEIRSIYFGGGTPSILTAFEIASLLKTINEHYQVSKTAEITLEANPDDLSEDYVKDLSAAGVNRLSLGVQSFNEKALQFMNRAHNAKQAHESLEWVSSYFTNFSLDLIYGLPDGIETAAFQEPALPSKIWMSDVQKALEYKPAHISSYALTVEPKTVLHHQIQTASIPALNEERAAVEYHYLKKTLKKAGYGHYEFSNFSLAGLEAVNNAAYWEGKSYIGIGPSAHSYHSGMRSWNISNNTKYIKSLFNNILPSEKEVLSLSERYNEFVMTGLRTAKGVSTAEISALFGAPYSSYILKEAAEKMKSGQLILNDQGVLTVAPEAQFFTDGLAAHLFYID